MKRKVFVGFSGGVDSSVSAHLLKEKYDVTAVMFRNISNPACSKPIEENAKKVAKYLDIPLKIVDFTVEFEKLVITPFINSYKEGKTPNPCVTCNIQFKFGKFAHWCFKNGADLIATGHYCITKNGHLYRGKDRKKDQSYFLNGVSSTILKKTLFPVGNLQKEDVRKIAIEQNLPNKSRHDSQEVCFINTSLENYLQKYINFEKGDIVDIDTGEVLGQHNGLHSFTLGQRKGIKIGGSNKPYFVAKKDTKTNSIYVAKGKLNPALWKDTFELENFNVIHPDNKGIKEDLTGMVRYRSTAVPCSFDWNSNTVRFSKKIWTPSVGQSLVIYKNDECIGGGVIKNIRR
jgi:tRNA-specific 2-thiouridylase